MWIDRVYWFGMGLIGFGAPFCAGLLMYKIAHMM